jgi:hypothetical protein
MSDFPFGIMDVANLLGLHVKRETARGVYTDCPVCGDTRGKMHINIEDDCWRCNYCDAGGGMLRLYGMICGISNAEAYRAIINGLPTDARERKFPPSVANSLRADSDTIHRVMTRMLELLPLFATHRENLRKRGLTDTRIAELGYKSAPPPNMCRDLTERLILEGYDIRGVPGFYLRKDDKWSVSFGRFTAGFLVPVRDLDRRIQGCQIRLDTPSGGAKYIWLSSASKHMGASPGSPIHFVGSPSAKTVYVTEGALKGDVASFLSGRSFVCLAGANNCGKLAGVLSQLARRGVETVAEAHDMVKFTNAQVAKGAERICSIAQECGLDVTRLTWDAKYKGIDDKLLSLRA